MIRFLRLFSFVSLVLFTFPFILNAQIPFRTDYASVNKNKEQYQKEYYRNHPFKQRRYTSEQLEAIPKQDRPDLGWEQNFLMTMDPALGYPPTERLKVVRQYVKNFNDLKMPATPGELATPWVERGPSNVGGRTRAIMYDPSDASGNKVWAGGVAGGLWFTTDITNSATTWTKVDDVWDNLAITGITADPNDSSIFYVCTGEGFGNIDAVRGEGIWKSTNAGTTWAQLASTDNAIFFYNQKIMVNPANSDIYVATGNNGVMRSQNGGVSWTQVLGNGNGANTNRVADIEIGADNTIYVAMGLSETDGIYRSTTGNLGSWTFLSAGGNGFPAVGFERIELATAPSDANVIYAIPEDASNNEAEGIYRSSDKGSNWVAVTNPTTASAGGVFTRNQAWYDLIMVVDPADANTVYIGGIDILKSTNGGTTWNQQSFWSAFYGTPVVHADQHAMAFKPGSSTEMIFGNDGGIYYTANAAVAFTDRNLNYNVTQFYSCAIHPTAGTDYFLAGAQDNGTQQFNSAGINATVDVSGGDGMFCFIDQSDPNFQITSYVYNTYDLSSNGGTSFPTSLSSDQNSGKFINPTDYDNSQDVLYSSYSDNKIQRILNLTTVPIVDSITIPGMTDMASAFTVSPYTTSSTTLYIGTEQGQLFKVTNAESGSPTTLNISDALFPFGNISCIAIGANENELLVTFSNYGVSSVFYSGNGGTSWADIDQGFTIPDMPVRWAMFDPNDSRKAIFATEVGVWENIDITNGFTMFTPSNSGLANVRVDMLQMRTSDQAVIAATHGRGLFSSTFSSIACSVPATPGTITGEDTVCDGASGITYSIVAVPGATKYNWTLPTGASITAGDTTTSITVTFGSVSGNVCVNAEDTCGISANQCFAVIVNSAPTIPGIITSLDTLCPLVSGATFSVASVAGASSYFWRVPADATITAGQGTTNITVDWGSISGNVCVHTVNSCDTSANQCKAMVTDGSAPPNAEPVQGINTVCVNQLGVSYTTDTVVGAGAYIWTLPAGATFVSGQGTKDIVVNFGTTAGNLCVKIDAENGCGTGPDTCLLINVGGGGPPVPGSITGDTAMCANALGKAYVINPVVGASSYNWTIPADATILVGQGTTSIIVNFGTIADSVCVNSQDSCGTSSNQCIFVNVGGSSLPAPDSIIGDTIVCDNAIGMPYSVPTVVGAISYTWSVGSGMTITSGQGTNAITVDFTLSTDSICVSASDSCGAGPQTCIDVSTSPGAGTPAPDSISGGNIVCANETNVSLTATPVSGATSYVWTVPLGSVIVSGQGTQTVVINFGTIIGNVCVQALGGCGLSAQTCRLIDIQAFEEPQKAGNIKGKKVVCPNEAFLLYRVDEVLGITNYTWSVPSDATIISGQGSTEVRIDFGITNGSICVNTQNVCGTTPDTCISLLIGNCTGIESFDLDNLINVYPNPSSGLVTLNINYSSQADFKVKVLNTVGQIIKQFNLDLQNGQYIQNIDFSNEAKGLYFIQVTSSVGQISTKTLLIE